MTLTEQHALAVGPGPPADATHLLAVHVSSHQLGAALGGDAPEAVLARALAYRPGGAPPRLMVHGAAGAGKTSLMLRAAQEASAYASPLDVLIVRAGADPTRLATVDDFVALVLEGIRSQQAFATIRGEDLQAIAAASRTHTPKSVSHDATIDAKVVRYRLGFTEAVTSLTEDVTPAERREVLGDAIADAATDCRMVVIVDDTDRFAAEGPDGLDVTSIDNLMRNGIDYLAELPVSVMFGAHPAYERATSLGEIAGRHGFTRVDVPAFPKEAGVEPLSAILDRRLEVGAIDDRRAGELFEPAALAVLQARYFESGRHDIRDVLRKCHDSMLRAAREGAGQVALRHVQQALDPLG